MRDTLSYEDAVEMHERCERLYLVQRNVTTLELALMEIVQSGVDNTNEEEYRRIFMELEMAKSNLMVATHNVAMGRGQISGYGRLL